MMTKKSNILINFGTLPYLLQKLVIDIFVPIIIGGIGFVVLIFFNIDMLIQIIIISIIFVIILIYTDRYHRHHQQQQQNNKIEPYING
jgi:membrane protein implicated in regulation of membrane protease activity